MAASATARFSGHPNDRRVAMAETRVANGEVSAAARENMRIAHTGLRHSEQTKAAIGAANRKRMSATDHDGDPRTTPDDVLDETMTANDLVFVLEHLRFEGRDRLAALKLDRHARDYLIDALQRRTYSPAWRGRMQQATKRRPRSGFGDLAKFSTPPGTAIVAKNVTRKHLLKKMHGTAALNGMPASGDRPQAAFLCTEPHAARSGNPVPLAS
jgi:hypothetical protein